MKLIHPLTNRKVCASYTLAKEVCESMSLDELPPEWKNLGALYIRMGYDISFKEKKVNASIELNASKSLPSPNLEDTLRQSYKLNRVLPNNTMLYEELDNKLRCKSYYILGKDVGVIRSFIQHILQMYPTSGYGTIWSSRGTYPDETMVWYIFHSTSSD